MSTTYISTVLNRQLVFLAKESMARGEYAGAGELAHSALKRSLAVRDQDIAAQAMVILGKAHVLGSEFKLAFQYGSLAAHMFAENSNIGGHAEALSLVSYAASALELSDASQAVTDLDAVLNDGALDKRMLALSHNYLGVADFWDDNYLRSETSLSKSQELARKHGAAVLNFHPLINRCFLEVLKVLALERLNQEPVDCNILQRLVSRCQASVAKLKTEPIGRDSLDVGLMLLEFTSCFAAVRMRNISAAEHHYKQCLLKVLTLPEKSWLRAVVWWARAELAKGCGDLHAAKMAAQSMQTAALGGQHIRLERFSKGIQADLSFTDF